MTREQFEDLSEKEQIAYVIKHYTSKLSEEKIKVIIDFVYDFDLLNSLLEGAELNFDETELTSYEDDIGFIPHQDNARF